MHRWCSLDRISQADGVTDKQERIIVTCRPMSYHDTNIYGRIWENICFTPTKSFVLETIWRNFGRSKAVSWFYAQNIAFLTVYWILKQKNLGVEAQFLNIRPIMWQNKPYLSCIPRFYGIKRYFPVNATIILSCLSTVPSACPILSRLHQRCTRRAWALQNRTGR